MPEVSQIFANDEAKKVREVGQSIAFTDDKLEKLILNLDKADAIMKEGNLTLGKMKEAQKSTARTSKELDEVGKKLEQTERRLNELQDSRTTKIIKNRQELQNHTRQTKLAITATESLKGSYKAISAQLSQNLIKYKNMSAQQRDNTKAGKNLEKTIARQRAELAKLDSRMGSHTRNVGNYRGAITGAARSLLGAFGLVGGVVMFARVLMNAFGTVKNFTKENAVLAGVLGKTRDQVSDLTDQAVELGSIYPTTASEVTKLQVSFARLGFTMAEIQGLTEATIQGSIAMNSSLDDTATLVGSIVRAFQDLGTQDTGRIIDVITRATQLSSQSFETMETAIPKAAAAASAMGDDIEALSAKLGIAQDATLDASTAGTSLRNIYITLSKEGLTFDEAMDKINNSSDKLNTAFELFGKRGAIVGLALAENRDRTAELEAELRAAGGTAERVAEVQMDNLDGSLKAASSSWEKFILGFKESDGIIKRVVDSWTLALNTFTNKSIAGWKKWVEASSLGLIDVASKEQKRIDDLTKKLSGATAAQIEFTLERHREELESGDKTDKAILQMLEDRLVKQREIEEKAAEDKKKRDEKATKDAELAELAATRERNEKIEEERKKAEEKINKEIERQREQHFRNLRKQTENYLAEDSKLQGKRLFNQREKEQEFEKSKKTLETDDLLRRNEERKSQIDKELEELAQAEEIKNEIRNAAFDTAKEGVNAFFDFRRNNLEKQFQVLEMQKEAELAKEGLTAEQKQKIEEKYAKKSAALKTKQAKQEKTQAIINSLINTALGITSALSKVATIPLVPFIAASGAIQTAVIASQPLPKFKKGTKDAPKSFIAGDGGREFVELVTGEMFLANKDTIFSGDKFKGATVHTNAETEKMLSGKDSTQVTLNLDSFRREQRKGTNRIVRAIYNSEQKRSKAITREYKERYL